MARFFIDRPIFAWVIAIIVSIAGALSVLRLPVSQYPAVAPPAIQIQAAYPGASARTLEETVTQVIEQRMNGLDGLRYISSGSDSTGGATIELVFEPGTDPDIAQVQVQNKLALAMPQLPQEVQRQGIRVAKSNRNFLLIATFVSRDGSMSRNDISDYVFSTLQDPISRVPGVGDVQVFGAPYAMRIWLDPDRLASFKLTPLDVRDAVMAQNAQVSVGEFGGTPAVKGQALNATITAQSRLSTPDEFAAILLRVNPDGSQVRLRDVARIELTGETFIIESFCDNSPCSGLGIRLAAGANALATADAVKRRFAELSVSFPPALEATYPVDTTPFVRISIEEVVKTLLEAIGLVFLVMLVFLQNLRATLIPTLAVPVVLLGTLGVLQAFGYSINTLTLFGMVLAIGLLVDDAIVVVENVERVMHDEGLSPKEATRRSMQQITGALVGIALVLAAVFVPMAFFGGSIGVIYRQFSITIVAAMSLSVLVALSFTPALCASMLKAPKPGPRRGFYGLFNRGYDATNRTYARAVGGIVRRRWYAMIVFFAIGGALALLAPRMPKSFLPEEDQGQLNAQLLLPPGATQEQTRAVLDRVSRFFLDDEKEAVKSVLAINGFGFGGRGQNTGLLFIKLRHWDERKSEHLRAKAVAARATRAFAKIKEANVFTFAPPAIPELGTVGGFAFQLEDRAGLGHDALIAARDQLLGLAAKHPKLARVRPAGLEDRPEYKIDVDREKAAALGLSLSDINQTLSATWGGAYVNDFIDDGRTKRVYMQADAPFRMSPNDLNRWYVRNRAGEMVPFSSFASGKWTFGAPKLDRFNGFPTVALNGEAAPGASSGDAMEAMEELATQLPQGFGYEWSGVSYDERASGANAPILYALSLLVVFLCLAALYESWSIPISVMLVVPLGVIGAVGATLLAGHANDVYFQVGLLATIGLSAKNAILIVEFAKELVSQGKSPTEAVMEAARMRLRPIIMTSLAFILGVLPLALANSAGAGAQNAIGIAIIGGVLAATILGVLFVPVFFIVISRRPRPPAVAAALIALCSCSLAPKYERPAAPVANQWEVASAQSADLGWRDVMRDPRLQAIVELALKNNRDLRVAALNVELVRAQYRIERASLFPALSGVASAEVTGNKDDARPQYTVGGGVAYELDLFGKLRSQRTAAHEEYLASAEAARAARIALVGEIATQFLVAQAFDEQLTLAKQTLALVQESADVTKRLAEQGQRSDLDLHTAEAQIHAARAEVARVTRLRAQANNALLLLAGVPAFPQLPSATTLETTTILADLPPGVPSQVLLRRPDVLAAEHALKAANANIGVARAAFFPSISLTAFGGLASTALSSLFTAGAFVWSAGATLAQPLFTGGKLRASLDVAEVRKQIEVARYEAAIQIAFREVADALAAKAALDEQLAAQLARVDAEQKRFAISEQRYKAGIESYIVMITAQRDLFAAQQGLIDVRLQRAANLVALYRALGGGWR